MTDATLPSQAKERFVFIDGLRAIAALAVFIFHVQKISPIVRYLPVIVLWSFNRCECGVQIFFVISGFVIAHSLSRLNITTGSALNFILRRQIRLDPTYWSVLALTCGVALLFGHPAVWDLAAAPPVFLVNMFYLEDLLKIPNMLVVSWTLCLEVQFYLVYILLLWMVQRAGTAKRQGIVMAAIIVPMLALSYWLHFVLDFPRPIFIKTWYLFALGVLVYWTMMRLVPSFILLAILAVLAGTAAVQNDQQMFAGAATGAVIYLAALRGGLSRWLGGPVLQYFGRISYSLYLVHFNVAADVFRVGRHITGGGDPGDAFWFLTSMAAAIGVAHVLNKYIERPSMNLASRFKPRPAPRATAPSPTAAANPPADSPANTPPARTPVAP